MCGERDPAIHSSVEVLLYPSFWAVLEYRTVPQALSEKALFFWPLDLTALRQKNRH